MLKTVYFDAHHRHKWQCFRIRLVDKYLKGVASNFSDANEICIYGIAFYKKECQVLLAKAKQEQNA